MAPAQWEKRERRIRDLRARNLLLEETLRAVWLWLARESDNPELLRRILLKADQDRQIHEALDRLVKTEAD